MLKFGVKNLGRIASAEIEVAPLTILIGKNNTGKSYLASLIWALAQPSLLSEVGGFRRRPAWFAGFVKPNLGTETRRLLVDQSTAGLAAALYERALNRKGRELLSNVFAYDGFSNTKFKIAAPNHEPLEFYLEPYAPRAPNEDQSAPQVTFGVRIGESTRGIYLLQNAWFDSASPWIGDLIFNEILGYCLFGHSWTAYRRQTYIPAARTGIMLALPALVSQSFGARQSSDRLELPRTLTTFLSRMTEGQSGRRPRPRSMPVRDRLVQELLRGQITSTKETVSDFRYSPADTDLSLPLYATSSMITELAPFMVALDNEPGTNHFVFEEPEAHLHLEAQREMARLIARLVSAGTPVTLTTHSDTFLQQINNLIVLQQHPQQVRMMEQLGYDPADLINPLAVKAYEFCSQGDGTHVRQLERTKEGFVVETLNSTLLALAEETLSLRSGANGR